MSISLFKDECSAMPYSRKALFAYLTGTQKLTAFVIRQKEIYVGNCVGRSTACSSDLLYDKVISLYADYSCLFMTFFERKDTQMPQGYSPK